ncbi:glycoside hydrolase family 16 protein [Saccharata proteae CBS 121410]|uniref:Glycoside hydrolase family 16 protein n=1 Tax=Saccharata proteae CBS 121410 TaxID=1314787 RepID=A0A9P4HP59_9PEZI|nr:glycoside hydrolase family 16 protein [Saccharata proteae CBS 121410]
MQDDRYSTVGISSAATSGPPTPNTVPYFRSRRVEKGEIQTPRMSKKKGMTRESWLWINPVLGLIGGLGVAGALIYTKYQQVIPHHDYCAVLNEDFSSGQLDRGVWTPEIQVNGFGNGEFDETTDSPTNLFILNNQLHIRPTLQDAALITNNNIINLTQAGTCTSPLWSSCVASTNTTNGTIVPPARSARINTKKGANIKYGRVEVRAKMPKGDWLWPAIWMLPTDNAYGAWPASGEIDIAESRGNNHSYWNGKGGNDFAVSTLHWGPDTDYDAYWRTTKANQASHSEYGDKFHTYGLEWTKDYLFTYIDSRLRQVLYVPFVKKTMWEKGDFPASDHNGSRIADPWSQTGNKNTPFDQYFHIMLNVAVGGTNGWFPDGIDSKPWADASQTARRDFWAAKDQWYPTWQESNEMVVDSVKMWQQC